MRVRGGDAVPGQVCTVNRRGIGHTVRGLRINERKWGAGWSGLKPKCFWCLFSRSGVVCGEQA